MTMRLIKILLVLLLLVPQALDAKKTTGRRSSSRRTTATTPAKPAKTATPAATPGKKSYPLFNSTEAASLWKKWRSSGTFTQEEYARAIDLCTVCYDYLVTDMEDIVARYSTTKSRVSAFNNLDNGVGSQLFNFSNNMSKPLHQDGCDGKLSAENVARLNNMLASKKKYKQLRGTIFGN